jgi:uncharacterized protein (TIGR03000 family)
MTYSRWLGLVLCSLAVFPVLLVQEGSSRDDTTKKTTLRVLLPQSRCKVMVDGKTIRGKGGAERTFTAPALAKGKKEYEVTVTWLSNDYTRWIRSKKAAPKPGSTVDVDLRKPDPDNPDRLEIRYVPTPDDIVERMCKLGKVTKDDIVFDLGCGDGRIVITAVRDFKAKRGVGIDLDPERIRESKENATRAKLTDKVAFRIGDVLKIKDLSDATVVMLYMGDDVNLRLRPILQKTLKPGARIVSHRFLMGDWKPDKTEIVDGADGDEYRLHLWTIKKK